jgi:hypothetical protein
MPGVKAFMLSLLAVRRFTLQAQFLTHFPSAWLVWEPGVWQPAAGGPSPDVTRITSMKPELARPVGGDALCFALTPGAPLRVGRAPGCDVVVNDATVSREHLWLDPVAASAGWAVRPQPGASTTSRNGQPLAPGVAQLLSPGDSLRLGDVTLTYHDAPGMAARLDAVARGSAQRRG